MKEVKLPSGAVLRLNHSPFKEANDLWQTVLEEMKPVSVGMRDELPKLFKDILCYGLSSRKIQSALNECMKRCQYCDGRGELKIDGDTFEPLESRQDYLVVCKEVMEENLSPFGKSLMQLYSQILETVESIRA